MNGVASIKKKIKVLNLVFNTVFISSLVADLFFPDYIIVIERVSMLALTPISGGIALLNHKLPKKERTQINPLASNSFRVHPYITFAVILVLDIGFLLL